MNTPRTLCLWAAPLLAMLLTAPFAQAGGFLISKIGGDSAGPASPSPSALFWNPAAMGLLEGTQLYLDTNLLVRSGTFTRDTTGSNPNGQLFDTAKLTSTGAQPMLAATSDLGMPDLHFGLGLYAPFGSSSVWDDPGGAQRYQAIFGSISSIYVTPALAWTPTPDLHFGVSLSYIRTGLTSYRALDLGPLVAEVTGGDVPEEEPGNEGRVLLDFGGNAFSYAFGAVWKPGDWTLGLSYTSEVSIDMEGRLKIFGPRNDFYQNLLGGDLDEPARLKATWPRALRLGATVEAAPGWILSFSAEWVQWSLYDKLVVDVKNDNVAGLGNFDQEQITAYRNTLGVRLGARRQLSDDFQVFGGIGGEDGAIPKKHLDPSLFDSLKLGFSLGLTWWATPELGITSSYNHLFYLPTTVGITEVAPPPTGVHTQQVGILNVNLTYRL